MERHYWGMPTAGWPALRCGVHLCQAPAASFQVQVDKGVVAPVPRCQAHANQDLGNLVAASAWVATTTGGGHVHRYDMPVVERTVRTEAGETRRIVEVMACACGGSTRFVHGGPA